MQYPAEKAPPATIFVAPPLDIGNAAGILMHEDNNGLLIQREASN
jgi:hypothetical protein